MAESKPSWLILRNDPYVAEGAAPGVAHRTKGTREFVTCVHVVNDRNSEFELRDPASWKLQAAITTLLSALETTLCPSEVNEVNTAT